jgi:hypothetical protein
LTGDLSYLLNLACYFILFCLLVTKYFMIISRCDLLTNQLQQVFIMLIAFSGDNKQIINKIFEIKNLYTQHLQQIRVNLKMFGLTTLLLGYFLKYIIFMF